MPDELFALRSLRVLDLSWNMLRSIPAALSQCVVLETLLLRENDLHELPDCFASLQQLTALDVTDNALQRLPSSLAACTQLRLLQLQRNLLPPETVATTRAQFASVRQIDLDPQLTGAAARRWRPAPAPPPPPPQQQAAPPPGTPSGAAVAAAGGASSRPGTPVSSARVIARRVRTCSLAATVRPVAALFILVAL